jgi:hypothetical protein
MLGEQRGSPIWLGDFTNCEKYHGVEPFNTVNCARFCQNGLQKSGFTLDF